MTGAALAPSSTDHRRSDRHRAFLGAKLVYGDGAFTIDCIVRDLSETGARVKVPAGQAVPDHLFLLESKSGVAYEAKVAWKRHPELGLQFIQIHKLDEASTPHMLTLKRIWTETQQRSGI